MKVFIYCHKTKTNLFDDIAIVYADSIENAEHKLSKFYSDLTNAIIKEIVFESDFEKKYNIKIITEY